MLQLRTKHPPNSTLSKRPPRSPRDKRTLPRPKLAEPQQTIAQRSPLLTQLLTASRLATTTPSSHVRPGIGIPTLRQPQTLGHRPRKTTQLTTPSLLMVRKPT